MTPTSPGCPRLKTARAHFPPQARWPPPSRASDKKTEKQKKPPPLARVHRHPSGETVRIDRIGFRWPFEFNVCRGTSPLRGRRLPVGGTSGYSDDVAPGGSPLGVQHSGARRVSTWRFVSSLEMARDDDLPPRGSARTWGKVPDGRSVPFRLLPPSQCSRATEPRGLQARAGAVTTGPLPCPNRRWARARTAGRRTVARIREPGSGSPGEDRGLAGRRPSCVPA
mgnify:CR=1 FL=1